MKVQHSRGIEQIVLGQPTSDGAGVRLLRVIHGPALQKRLDPYLLFDHFGSDNPDDYIAGFPDHPHRGIETITLMKQGRMRHNDSRGGKGVLENDGVQWMTAGKGIIHSELPQQESGAMEGFQLWLNLPASRKMIEPWYQDFQKDTIPAYTTDKGAQVRVVAGQSGKIKGAHQREVTEPLYLEVTLPAGVNFEHTIPTNHNAFIYVYRQSVQVGEKTVSANQMGILSNANANVQGAQVADGIILKAPAGLKEPAKFLLITGKPLNEPIVQYGPFAMNTQEEIIQAINDYQSGTLR